MAVNAKSIWAKTRRVSKEMVNGTGLKDINKCWASGIMPKDLIDYDLNNHSIPHGGKSYAILWNMLRGTDSGQYVSFGAQICFYHFRRVEVADFLSDGQVYAGHIRVGIERTPDSLSIPSSKLPVVIYDKDLKVLAKIASYDWAANNVRNHIGDTSASAMLFCDNGGYHGTMFLYMVLVWNSDLRPYKEYRGHGISLSWHSYNYFVKATAPEAVSDLTVGEHFDAKPTAGGSSGVGLTRIGMNYPFASLPSEFGEALSCLAATGYPELTLHCVNHGLVRSGDEWTNLLEVLAINAETVEKLAYFRRESGLDVRFDWEYETLRFEKVDAPYGIPFEVVEVELVAVPVPKRKNPLVELRVNGILVNTVRYRDYRYDHFKDLVGTKSVWAKLHYDEKDIPYLDVIWNRGKEADEAS